MNFTVLLALIYVAWRAQALTLTIILGPGSLTKSGMAQHVNGRGGEGGSRAYSIRENYELQLKLGYPAY
jgi:hypothetical protein